MEKFNILNKVGLLTDEDRKAPLERGCNHVTFKTCLDLSEPVKVIPYGNPKAISLKNYTEDVMSFTAWWVHFVRKDLNGFSGFSHVKFELVGFEIVTEPCTIKEYYGIAMALSDDEQQMECLLQEGTGNAVETSKLVTHLFPYSAMKKVITNEIDKSVGIRNNLVTPEQFFKVKITESEGKITYSFFAQEETEELVELFKKPDYFKDLGDTSFFKEG